MSRFDSFAVVDLRYFERDTATMNAAEVGCYIRLYLYGWTHDGTLPSEDEELATITRHPLAAWKRLAPKVLRKFKRQAGVWTHPDIIEELARSRAISEKNRSAAEKRWKRSHLTLVRDD